MAAIRLSSSLYRSSNWRPQNTYPPRPAETRQGNLKGKEMADDESNAQIGGIAAEALRQFVERIERLEEEKKALSADIKDVYGQAKSQGFDVKILRKIISLRKMEDQEREEVDQLLELYKAALGMV
jgi:uncharacterized protein (UPF0335 family)